MIINSKGNISQFLMANLLNEICTIKRVRELNRNNKVVNNKWTKSLIVDGEYIANSSFIYPMIRINKDEVRNDLYKILKEIFEFKKEDILEVVDGFIKKKL